MFLSYHEVLLNLVKERLIFFAELEKRKGKLDALSIKSQELNKYLFERLTNAHNRIIQ